MKLNKGFTLLELMVVIAIIAMLAAYALPNYRQYVVQSKRAEAHAKVLEVAGMYEKFYANTNAYPTDVEGGAGTLGLSVADYLRWDDYRIRQANNAQGATWRVQAVARNAQRDDDTDCRRIWIDNLGQRGPSDECWNN